MFYIRSTWQPLYARTSRLLPRLRKGHCVTILMDQFSGKTDQNSLDKFKQFYESRRTESAVVQGYENWAEHYDKDFDAIAHRGHVIIGDVMEELYLPEDRTSISILDVAAASGRVGQELKKRGFGSMDALDACAPMLDAAKEKNVYRRLILSKVGEEPLDIPTGSYDAITCCAAFIEGHLPVDAVKELVRLVKPGGVVVVIGFAAYVDLAPEYTRKLDEVITALESEGRVTTLKRETREGMLGSQYPASVIVLKKTR